MATQSDSTNIVAEFRWEGATVIRVRDLGPEYKQGRIQVYCPTQLSQYFLNWNSADDLFDRAFLDIIEHKLARLNELKLNLQNRRMTQHG